MGEGVNIHFPHYDHRKTVCPVNDLAIPFPKTWLCYDTRNTSSWTLMDMNGDPSAHTRPASQIFPSMPMKTASSPHILSALVLPQSYNSASQHLYNIVPYPVFPHEPPLRAGYSCRLLYTPNADICRFPANLSWEWSRPNCQTQRILWSTL